jgi:hypothetical protein
MLSWPTRADIPRVLQELNRPTMDIVVDETRSPKAISIQKPPNN